MAYKKMVPHPEQVVIQKSRPYHMRYPTEQALFFELLTSVLYYIISGHSKVGFLAADDWNKYYRAAFGLDVCPVFVRSES